MTLQKASLQKKDLDLELEELEAAARMVAEDEEREAFNSTSCSDSGSAPTDSSGSSSDESEASEAEDVDNNEVGGGGGGGGTLKDNPLQPQRCSTASSIPQEHTSTLLDTLPSASEGCRQLIQELEERVAKGLNLSQDWSNKAEGSRSRADSAVEQTEGTSEGSSSGNLLEPRNPLLILQTQEDL